MGGGGGTIHLLKILGKFRGNFLILETLLSGSAPDGEEPFWDVGEET